MRHSGVAAAINAGGRATRLGGACKASLDLGGRSILQRQLDVLTALFDEILVVSDDPAPFAGLRVVPDARPGAGPLSGLRAALAAARAERVLFVACDMPRLRAGAIELLLAAPAADVVIPRVGACFEPLHALYARSCLPAIDRALAEGRFAMVDFHRDVRVSEIPEPSLRAIDPALAFLRNVNTVEDLARARRELLNT